MWVTLLPRWFTYSTFTPELSEVYKSVNNAIYIQSFALPTIVSNFITFSCSVLSEFIRKYINSVILPLPPSTFLSISLVFRDISSHPFRVCIRDASNCNNVFFVFSFASFAMCSIHTRTKLLSSWGFMLSKKSNTILTTVSLSLFSEIQYLSILSNIGVFLSAMNRYSMLSMC